MTRDEARQVLIDYWFEKAHQALDAAHSDLAANRPEFAMNRAYYACFYAASAVLLHEGLSFKKHAGVRSSLHAHLVHTGRLSVERGRLYDKLMEWRHKLDYMEFASIDSDEAREYVQSAIGFVADIAQMVKRSP